MNNYEIVYIIHPALQEGRLIDIKSKIHEKITSSKGKVLYDDNWGKKKLAYAIDKQKYGTYLFCQFLLGGKDIQEINIDCELNSNILRHLITRIDSTQVLDEKDKKEIKKETKHRKEVSENEQVKEDDKEEISKDTQVKEEISEKESIEVEIDEANSNSDNEEIEEDNSKEK